MVSLSFAIDMPQVELGWKPGINTVTECVKAGSAAIQKHQCMKTLYVGSQENNLFIARMNGKHVARQNVFYTSNINQNPTAMRSQHVYPQKNTYGSSSTPISTFFKISSIPTVLLFGWRGHSECACCTPGGHLGLSAILRLTGRA